MVNAPLACKMFDGVSEEGGCGSRVRVAGVGVERVEPLVIVSIPYLSFYSIPGVWC